MRLNTYVIVTRCKRNLLARTLRTYNTAYVLYTLCAPSMGFSVNLKFSFLNFVLQRGTETRFESPSHHKHKRCMQ
jgi:hypothetical protein